MTDTYVGGHFETGIMSHFPKYLFFVTTSNERRSNEFSGEEIPSKDIRLVSGKTQKGGVDRRRRPQFVLNEKRKNPKTMT